MPAKIFFEKGFDNVYLLTGGIEEFHSHFPEYIEGSNIPEPIPIGKFQGNLTFVESKTQQKKKTIRKGRQPTYTKGRPMSKVSKGTHYGKKKAPSRIGGKTRSRLGNAGQRLVGSHKQQFDDIPDSISHFSKITGTRNNYNKKSPSKTKEVTAKPNQIIMDGKANLATIKEKEFTGLPQKREVTDKPNNIRTPIGFNQNARF